MIPMSQETRFTGDNETMRHEGRKEDNVEKGDNNIVGHFLQYILRLTAQETGHYVVKPMYKVQHFNDIWWYGGSNEAKAERQVSHSIILLKINLLED